MWTLCTADLILYYDIPSLWERDYERRVGKWDTAISITWPVKTSMLWYIAHSFDVIKKTKHVQYMQRLYLGFFFISPITQSFILPIPCLFSCLTLPRSRGLSTLKHSLVTPCSLHGAPQPLTAATPIAHWAWTTWLLWLNTAGSPLPNTFKSRNCQVVRIISLPRSHENSESRAQNHCKFFHPWQWGSFTSKYTVKHTVKSVKRQSVIALFRACYWLFNFLL